MPETVFLTGGAGRIGKRLLRQLLEKGYHVKVLVHHHEPEEISSNHMTLVRGDLCDRSSFAEAVEGCDFVCHLAAVFDMGSAIETDSENDHLFKHLIQGTYNVLEAARQARSVKLFTYASSDAVFCAIYKHHAEPITEDIELCPRPGRFYAMAKATTESMCANYQKTYGLPYAVLRVGWCLDETDVLEAFRPQFWEALTAPEDRPRMETMLAGDPCLIAPLYENGESVEVQLGHAEDIATGFSLALKNHRQATNQVFNIAGSAPFKFSDHVDRVAGALGLPWEGVKLAGLGRYRISNEKAHQLLGYTPQLTIDKMIDLALG